MRHTTIALLLLGIQSTTWAALAKPSTDVIPAADEASQRFQRGVTLYHERSFDAALAEFNRAYELAPDYRVLYNIAQVQAERGDYVAAVKYFRRYLTEGGTAVGEPRTTEVRTEITRLEARTAQLHIVGNVEGAELLIDGEPAGTLPLAAVAVNAGARRITLRKKGFEPEELRLMLTGGEDKRVELVLRAEAPKSTALSPAGSNGSSATAASGNTTRAANTGFWISLVATGVAGGAAAAFGVLTHKSDSHLSDELNRYPASPNEIDDARTELKRNALLTDGCGALAVIGLGATIYFAATGGSEPRSTERVKSSGPSLRTLPFGAGTHAAGWQLSGRF